MVMDSNSILSCFKQASSDEIFVEITALALRKCWAKEEGPDKKLEARPTFVEENSRRKIPLHGNFV